MPQMSVGYMQGIGYEGMIGDTNIRVIRGALEQFVSNIKIPYGRAVCRVSPTSNKLTLPSAAGQKIIGIAIATDMYGYNESGYITDTVEAGYEPGVVINVLTWGDALIYTPEAVNVDDPVLFNYKQGTATDDKIGRFRKTAVATQTDPLPNSRFLVTTTAPGLAYINIGGA